MTIRVTSDNEVLVYFYMTYQIFEDPTPGGDNLTSSFNEFTGKTEYFWQPDTSLRKFGDFESFQFIWGTIEDPTEIGAEEPFFNPISFDTDPAQNGYDYYRSSIITYSFYPPSEKNWAFIDSPRFDYYDSLRSRDYQPFLPGKYESQFVPIEVLKYIPAQIRFLSLLNRDDLGEALAEQRGDLEDVFGKEDISGDDITVTDDDDAILDSSAEIGLDFLSRAGDSLKVVGDLTTEAVQKVHDTLTPILDGTLADRASAAIGDAASDAKQALKQELAELVSANIATRLNLIDTVDTHKQVYVQKEGALRKVILLDNGELREETAWTAKEAADIKARFLDAGLSEEQKNIRDLLEPLKTTIQSKAKTAAIGVRGALADKFGGLTGGELNDIADGFAQVVRPGLAFGNVTLGTLEYGFTQSGFAGADLNLTGETAYALGDDVDNYVTSDADRTRVALDSGNDRFEGGTGQDEVSGDGGADVLLGGGGGDWLYGGGGNDTVKGGAGFDALLGAGGRDNIVGGAGGDLLIGGGGNDVLKGGSGDDELRGEAGRDKLIGQGGNDLLAGGTGKDVLKGGGGADVFLFESEKEVGRGKKADKIIGFTSGEDQIDLSALFLTFVGTADFTGAGLELRWDADAGRLFGDIDGDGATDLALIVKGDFNGDVNDLIL